MLKEVGSSGQISLGKKFAGQLFDVQYLETGAVHMLPVRVVPDVVPLGSDRRLTRFSQPLHTSTREQWEQDNAPAIAALNLRTEQMGSPAQRLHAWRDGQTNSTLTSSAAFHQQFGAWVHEMNQMVEQHGVWSDGLMEAEQPHGTV